MSIWSGEQIETRIKTLKRVYSWCDKKVSASGRRGRVRWGAEDQGSDPVRPEMQNLDLCFNSSRVLTAGPILKETLGLLCQERTVMGQRSRKGGLEVITAPWRTVAVHQGGPAATVGSSHIRVHVKV